ncbi:hypothetical protein D3C87_1734510 [compost metagenome]
MLVRDIGGHHQGAHTVFARRRAGGLKRVAPTARQHHPIALSQKFQRYRTSNSCPCAGYQGYARRFDLVRMHRILLVINRRDATAIILAKLQAKFPTWTQCGATPCKQKKRADANIKSRNARDLSQVFI